MARPVWSGTVSFGLVAIPVILVPATRDGRVAFHLLHSTDHARLRRRMVCPEHGVVGPERTVRGFEVEPGRWVAVTDAELDGLEPKRSRNLEISDFVDLGAINPLYFDRPYYLLPDGADKPYRLLAVVLSETGKAGIGGLVMRGHEYLAAVVAIEGALGLFTLHRAGEIVAAEELLPATKAPAKEALAAQNLMVRMKSRFQPGQYSNEYHDRVLAMVKKRERQAGSVSVPSEPEAEPADATTPDLMEALAESLTRARAKAGRK